jgi:hypothetical protein
MRTLGAALVGLASFVLAGSAFAASPSLVGIPQSSDPTCSAGEYYLAVLTTGTKWRKCENGTWSDIGATAGAGEANTASNLGGGLANWDSKSGVDLRFNSFNSAHFDLGSNLISVDESGLEALLDLADLAGLLPLSKLTDDATSGLCLLSGGVGGDPDYGTCPGGASSGTELDQTTNETDLRYDATMEAYYYDVDGDAAHDTDGTEDYLDMLTIEVPGDYATVQAAIDSNDCKKGSTTAHQGCRIVVAPGTYSEVFEIGSTATTSADYQNSIVVEGAGFLGAPWTVGGANSCIVTFTGNDASNHDTITVNGAIGWSIRNLCIDMDASATNDTRYGIAIGTGGAVTKHGVVENVAIVDEGIAGGAGIRIGNGAAADVAFNTIRNVYMKGVRKCVSASSTQAVSNHIEDVSCSEPTDSIGCVEVVSGQLTMRRPYCRSGASSQIGIQIGSEAYNSDIYDPTFEWFDDNGTFVKYDNDTTSGQYRTHNILGGRFQPLVIPTTRHVCIDWNRRGQLNVSGVSFESSTSASRTCEVDLANPHATQSSEVNWVSNDVVWGAGTGGIVQPAMVFTESSAGGPLRVHKVEQGSVYVGQSGSIVFEGSSLDGFETTVTATNPTGDRNVTLPDANSSTVQPTTCGGTDKVSAISSAGVVTCSADAGSSGDSVRVESGTDSGSYTAATDLDFDDSGDIDFVLDTAPTPDAMTAQIRTGAVGSAEAAALDAGDVTTGSFADARINGAAESDEITGLTDSQISDTLTASTSTTAAAEDNDTSIATTAYVQGEFADLGAYTVGTTAPTDGSTACTEGDMYLDHTGNKIYWCVDSATDKWFGVALTDEP